MTEAGIGGVRLGAQCIHRNRAAHERRDQARSGFGVGNARQRGDIARRDMRIGERRVKTAINGEPGQQNIIKAKLRGFTASREIAQGHVPLELIANRRPSAPLHNIFAAAPGHSYARLSPDASRPRAKSAKTTSNTPASENQVNA